MVFFNTTTFQVHMACLGLVVFQMNDVPHFQVDSLPSMCLVARRDKWDIATAIRTEFQRVFQIRSISAQSGPPLEQRPRLGQFTLTRFFGRKRGYARLKNGSTSRAPAKTVDTVNPFFSHLKRAMNPFSLFMRSVFFVTCFNMEFRNG